MRSLRSETFVPVAWRTMGPRGESWVDGATLRLFSFVPGCGTVILGPNVGVASVVSVSCSFGGFCMARVPVVKNVRALVAQGAAVIVALNASGSGDEVKVAFGAERLTELSTAVENLESSADSVESLSRQYDAAIADRRSAEIAVTNALRKLRGLVVAFHPDNDRAAASYGFDVITTSAARPAPVPSVGG